MVSLSWVFDPETHIQPELTGLRQNFTHVFPSLIYKQNLIGTGDLKGSSGSDPFY